MITKSLKSLGIDDYVLNGEPKNEEEFNKFFKKVTGKDSINQAILSSDPLDFGVTWRQIEDQIKIEKEKAKWEAYQYDRLQEYPNTDDLIVALWEKVVEGRSESADALEVKRQQVKTAHPKPE